MNNATSSSRDEAAKLFEKFASLTKTEAEEYFALRARMRELHHTMEGGHTSATFGALPAPKRSAYTETVIDTLYGTVSIDDWMNDLRESGKFARLSALSEMWGYMRAFNAAASDSNAA